MAFLCEQIFAHMAVVFYLIFTDLNFHSHHIFAHLMPWTKICTARKFLRSQYIHLVTFYFLYFVGSDTMLCLTFHMNFNDAIMYHNNTLVGSSFPPTSGQIPPTSGSSPGQTETLIRGIHLWTNPSRLRQWGP